ncbi:MAG: hypothetical protein MJ075_01935 [Oscillospiraceae bacterium]|nr:hypothetical protein [Oscillospiraceae bacterium]
MNIKEQIKALAERNGMSLCGFANIERFQESPPELHPAGVLPGCKTVIVVGVRLLDGVIQANFRDFEDGRRDLKGLYGTYAYTMLPNFQLTKTCYDIAQLIEVEAGEIATPCSTGPMTNGRQVSIRHCAVAAGLGEFGWMSIVLTPQFGPRNRFGVILTTAEIEPDPLYSGPRLCNPEKCGICTKACPSGALSSYGEEGKRFVHMEDRTFEYCTVNMVKCFMVEERLRKDYGAPEDYSPSESPTPAELKEAQRKASISDLGLQHTPSWYCGRCLSYCPAGNWGNKFKKRGLSKGYTADWLYQGDKGDTVDLAAPWEE